jgi:hypothetical protein
VHSCQTFFFREGTYGSSETVLIPHAGRYTAAFPPTTVPCVHHPGEDAGTAQAYSVFKLWWSTDHILAIEHTRYVGHACGGGTDTTRWAAIRTNPGARAPGL